MGLGTTILDWIKEIPLSAVLKEKLATSEAKVGELKAENGTLRTENDVLQVELSDLKSHMSQLKQEISDLKGGIKGASTKPEQLDEKAEGILKAFGKLGGSHIDKEHLAETVAGNRVEFDYHFDELCNGNYIDFDGNEFDGFEWYSLDQKGRKYIMDHSLN